MTKTKSRFGMGTILVTCLVTAAGIAALRALHEDGVVPQPQASDEELVTFSATWKPSVRKQAIGITITIGEGGPRFFPEKNSPFVRHELVSRGTYLWMYVDQPEGGLLSCEIRKGTHVISRPSSSSTLNAVECAGVVP